MSWWLKLIRRSPTANNDKSRPIRTALLISFRGNILGGLLQQGNEKILFDFIRSVGPEALMAASTLSPHAEKGRRVTGQP